MPTPDHYADLVAEYGKDNDYEQQALDAMRLAANSSDDNDRLVASNAAITFALLHAGRALTQTARMATRAEHARSPL